MALGTRPRPPFDCIALLLQGGGALGAYQAGVYEALAEADLHPDAHASPIEHFAKKPAAPRFETQRFQFNMFRRGWAEFGR
jgi:hypothetical protein